jgi:hypothetical protein
MSARCLPRQRGVFGVLFAIMLPVMLAMVGLAIDLAMMYARGNELQAVADASALAAARALDGTQAGLTAARDNARFTAVRSWYRFLNPDPFSWSDEALSFGASADGPWIAAGAVSSSDLPTLLYARVDTSALDTRYGRIGVAFLQVVQAGSEQHMSRRAVAGRKDSALGPLAVCALNNTEMTKRVNATPGYDEALEYGFRRGVTYNLLNLNPHGITPRNYAINPLDFAPAPALPSHQNDAALRPFVCSGRIPAPPLNSGAMLYVREPFPASMVNELNSRFGDYGNGSICTKYQSPPDSNVIAFRDYPGFWMQPRPVDASAAELVLGARLVSIAEAPGVSPGTTAASYGTLWSFGRPLRYNSTTGGFGAQFNKNDWDKLYPVASSPGPESNYSGAISPYARGNSPHFQMPGSLSGDPQRRVLNVPLLQCPVVGSSARMLGIGRFLMTTPATSSPLGVHAEFGGLTTYGALAASAVLYR